MMKEVRTLLSLNRNRSICNHHSRHTNTDIEKDLKCLEHITPLLHKHSILR